MNYSIFFLLLGLYVFISYNVFYMLATHLFPISLSETYYVLKIYGKGCIFSLMLIICTITLMPIWLSISNENYQFLAFISCASSIFVALSPNYHLDLEKQVHYIAAYLCCLSTIMWEIFSGYSFVALFCFIPCLYPILSKNKSYTLFLEISTIFSIYISLILKIINNV